MQHYSCGFLFSPDRSRVLLIRKNRPTWQAGKLNGIGGKLESGETPLQAMRREFREEAGLDLDGWQYALTLQGRDWAGHFFRLFGDVDRAVSMTDEPLEVHPTRPLPEQVIPNLRWMIPMLLDDEVVQQLYRVSVGVCLD